MADELEENFLIENKFVRNIENARTEPSEILLDSEDIFNAHQTENTAKKRHKKKNITEILKIKESLLNKSAYCKNEFKNYLTDYIEKNMSIIEKNELDLDKDAIGKLILNVGSKKQDRNSLSAVFSSKFKRKFDNYKKRLGNRKSILNKPYMIVLCSSAQRCIQLQKEFNDFTANQIRWFYSFAKHKKLDDQIKHLNSNEVNLIYATPSRLMQLLDSKCLKASLLKYLVVDYKFRDCKLKRFFDLNEIKKEFFNLYFNYFRNYCKRIKLVLI
jgi:protein CMS1